MSADSIDSKLSHLEGSFQQFGRRFDSLERRFDSFERSVNNRLDSLERKVDMNFRWTMGVAVTSFVALSGTTISGFVAVLSRIH